jgi:hypothetical protein
MRKNLTIWAAITLLFILGLVGCNYGGESGPLSLEEAVQVGVQATLTKEAWLDGVETARKTAIAAENSSGDSDADEETISTPTPTIRPTQEPSPTPTLKPASEHQVFPGGIKERVDTYLVDYNSKDYADEHITYGDQYRANILERPFTADDMVYMGTIDIIRVNLKVSTNWTYAILYLAEDLPDSGTMKYGLEIDLDENGRGDYLIQTGLPTSIDWSVKNVQVYYDLDKDVGGKSPMVNNDPAPNLTGYEVLLFDSGEGEDPDLVWVRRNPDEKNSLQIAFKNDLIGMTGYLWSAWADDGLKAVDYRDYNDRFTEESAGSPYPGSPLYPIKALYLYDSTCRSYFGFTPTGSEPGLCP